MTITSAWRNRDLAGEHSASRCGVSYTDIFATGGALLTQEASHLCEVNMIAATSASPRKAARSDPDRPRAFCHPLEGILDARRSHARSRAVLDRRGPTSAHARHSRIR